MIHSDLVQVITRLGEEVYGKNHCITKSRKTQVNLGPYTRWITHNGELVDNVAYFLPSDLEWSIGPLLSNNKVRKEIKGRKKNES